MSSGGGERRTRGIEMFDRGHLHEYGQRAPA